MRKLIPFISLVLAIAVLFSGCGLVFLEEILDDRMHITVPPERPAETTAKPTRPTQEPSEEPSETAFTPYEEYERYCEPLLGECSFDEIVYERPDDQLILEKFEIVQKAVEDGASCEEIIDLYAPIDEMTTIFSTMSSYAYIRYTLDLNDTYYDEEYNWCEEQTPIIAQAEEKCFIAMSKSPEREALEEAYFGEDFFDFYDENQIYSNDRVVELMQQQSALEAEYMALQSDQTVSWKGEEVSVDDLLQDDTLDYSEYLDAIDAYYAKYNPMCAEILAELIKVRNEIAEELGYDSYADFAYGYHYERDYTPEQVRTYLDSIAKYLKPLYYRASVRSFSSEMEPSESFSLVKNASYSLGGEFATAFDYMEANGLYDISESTSKMPGSYMTYLPAYEMPYMYVSPTNDINDTMTVAHEFGHFVDGFVNCNTTSSTDCSEIFSQALEYLMIDELELSESDRDSLRSAKAADAILTFLSQACYADFEMQLYELDEKELTAENFNRIFGECTEKYLYDITGYEQYYEPGWFEIQHFFIAPHYVISYCVSLDAALQVYQCELEDESGIETYLDLLYLASGNTVQALLEEAGMVSPFADGRMADLKRFLVEQLND